MTCVFLLNIFLVKELMLRRVERLLADPDKLIFVHVRVDDPTAR